MGDSFVMGAKSLHFNDVGHEDDISFAATPKVLRGAPALLLKGPWAE